MRASDTEGVARSGASAVSNERSPVRPRTFAVALLVATTVLCFSHAPTLRESTELRGGLPGGVPALANVANVSKGSRCLRELSATYADFGDPRRE